MSINPNQAVCGDGNEDGTGYTDPSTLATQGYGDGNNFFCGSGSVDGTGNGGGRNIRSLFDSLGNLTGAEDGYRHYPRHGDIDGTGTG